MKNNLKGILTIENIICVALILIFPISLAGRSFVSDLFFDLKTGESILSYGIDFKDHFSFISNLVYLYPHWFYDLFLYFIYKIFGFNGMRILFVVIYFLFGFIFYKACNNYSKNKIVSAIVTIFVLFIGKYAFQSRVQTITYILFFLEFLCLEKLYKEGNKKYIVFLLIIAILVLNLHMPMWFFTIILFLPFLFETSLSFICLKNKKIDLFFKRYINIESPKSYRVIFISFILLICTGFLTPYLFNTYSFLVKLLGTSYSIVIDEMKRTVLFDFPALYLLMLVFILGIYCNVLKIKIRDLVLVLGLFVFSLFAARNVIYVYIFVPFVMIKSYTGLFSFKLNDFNRKIIIGVIALMLVVIYFVNIKINFKDVDVVKNDEYPYESVKDIRDNLNYKNIRLYNSFNSGAYIEFYDIPVFIDGRAEVYWPKFNGGKDVFSDYLDTFKYPDYKKVFEKYDFDYALVEKESDINYYLKNDKDFVVIFKEKKYVLYKCV